MVSKLRGQSASWIDLLIVGGLSASIAILLVGLLSWQSPFGSQIQLEIGEVAPYDVVAPRQITYESAVLTELPAGAEMELTGHASGEFVEVVAGDLTRIVEEAGAELFTVERFEGGDVEASAQRIAQLSEEIDAVVIAEGAPALGTIARRLGTETRLQLLGTGVWNDPAIATEPALQGGWFAASAPESAPIQAMHRIVSLADAGHTRAHCRELLKTGAQQFNTHALPRAVQVLEVARRLLAEGKVDKTTADLILSTAHEDLDAAELMAQTQQTATLPLLRSLLGAYPALTPAGLLNMLDDEPDRARRRLAVAHSPAASHRQRHGVFQPARFGRRGYRSAARQP